MLCTGSWGGGTSAYGHRFRVTGVVTDGSDTKLGTGGMQDQSATNFEEDTAMGCRCKDGL